MVILIGASFLSIFNLFHESLFMSDYYFMGGPTIMAIRLATIIIAVIAIFMVYFWKNKFLEECLEKHHQKLEIS